MADWDTYEKIDGKAIALRVKARRADIGMTQVSLARLAGVSQQSVCAIERGAIKIPRALPKLAQVLGTTGRYLTTGVEEDGAPLISVVEASKLKLKIQAIKEEKLGAGYKYLKPTEDLAGLSFAIRCQDNAMSPSVSLGDLLIIDLERKERPGDYVLLSALDDILVRKVRMQTQDSKEYLPINQDYPVISKPEQVFGVISEIRKIC